MLGGQIDSLRDAFRGSFRRLRVPGFVCDALAGAAVYCSTWPGRFRALVTCGTCTCPEPPVVGLSWACPEPPVVEPLPVFFSNLPSPFQMLLTARGSLRCSVSCTPWSTVAKTANVRRWFSGRTRAATSKGDVDFVVAWLVMNDGSENYYTKYFFCFEFRTRGKACGGSARWD
jgi:hypothetical protein